MTEINRYQTFFQFTKKIIFAYQKALLDRQKIDCERDLIRRHLADQYLTRIEKMTIAFQKTGSLTAPVISIENGTQTNSEAQKNFEVQTDLNEVQVPVDFTTFNSTDSPDEKSIYEVSSPKVSEPHDKSASKIDDLISKIRHETNQNYDHNDQDLDNLKHAHMQIETLNYQLQETENVYDKQKTMLISYQDSNRRLKVQNKELRREIEEIQTKYKKNKDLLGTYENLNELYKQENDDLKNKNEILEDKFNSLEKKVNSLRRDFVENSQKKKVIQIQGVVRSDTADSFDQIIEPSMKRRKTIGN